MQLPDWTVQPRVHAAGCFLSVLAAVAIMAFTIGTLEYTKTRGKLLLTALLMAGFFLTLVGATAMPRSGLGPWFRPAAIGVAVSALLLMVVGLWAAPDSNSLWRATASVTVLAMGLVAAGQVSSRASGRGSIQFVGRLLTFLTVQLTGMAVVGIALEIGAAAYWWVFGLLTAGWIVGSIVIACAWLWPRRAAKD